MRDSEYRSRCPFRCEICRGSASLSGGIWPRRSSSIDRRPGHVLAVASEIGAPNLEGPPRRRVPPSRRESKAKELDSVAGHCWNIHRTTFDDAMRRPSNYNDDFRGERTVGTIFDTARSQNRPLYSPDIDPNSEHRCDNSCPR